MALTTRSNVLAVVEESGSSLTVPASGADFVKLRAGNSFAFETETVDSDELTGDIGQAASVKVGESVSLSIPLYAKASGSEGTENEAGVMIESLMGSKTVNAVEYDTIGGSTTSVVVVDAGEGSNFYAGQALLVKDSTNGYSVRHVDSVAGDNLTLLHNLSNAPALGVDLGLAITYLPQSSGHPTYSAWFYQNTTSSGFSQAAENCRTNALNFEFPTKELASMTVEATGVSYFYNPIVVDATNNVINFTDSVGAVAGTLTAPSAGAYKTPIAAVEDIALQMTALSAGSGADTITGSYNSNTGVVTFSSSGGTFELPCTTANNMYTFLGFGTADLTGATSYTAATSIHGSGRYNPPYTPSFDAQDPLPVVNGELIVGGAAEITCKKAVSVSFNPTAEIVDVLSVCASNGVSEKLTNGRTAPFTATVVLDAGQAQVFDDLINNTTTRVQFTVGVKDNSGNWTPGTVLSIALPNVKLSGAPISESDGYHVYELAGSGFVDSTRKDIYINYL